MPRSAPSGSGKPVTGGCGGAQAGHPAGRKSIERGCQHAVHRAGRPDGRPAGDGPGPGGRGCHRRGAHPGARPPGACAQRLRGAARRALPGVPGARRHAVGAGGRHGGPAHLAAADPGEDQEARGMTPSLRRWVFLAGAAGLVAFYLWGLVGLPGFGDYPGPYGFIVNHIAVPQTKATGVVSAVNFEYRGFDTVGEEFILFTAAAGVSIVLRRLRGERQRPAVDEAADRDVPATSSAVRMLALLFTGPVVVVGWWLASHAQINPSGGFQGGVILATAFILVYLSGEFLVFKRFSPVALTDVVDAVGAGGFAAIGVSAVAMGLPYLTNFLPLGSTPGAVSSSGTIALISFFVGLEVAAAFVLIVGELLEQTLLIRQGGS